jgi:hypothetical protein
MKDEKEDVKKKRDIGRRRKRGKEKTKGEWKLGYGGLHCNLFRLN